MATACFLGGTMLRPHSADPPSLPLTLGLDHVDVWLLDPTTASASWIGRHVARLSPGEKSRAESYATASLRRDALCTRIMQRLVLSRYAGVEPSAWRFGVAPQGKPFIDHPPDQRSLRFSLSHTRGLIALAIGRDGEVGVDVEAWDDAIDVVAVARGFFAPDEVAHLMALKPDERRQTFFELWTLKEACLKAWGLGLSGRLDAVRFDRRGPDFLSPLLSDRAGPALRHVESARPTAGHMLGLAVVARPGCEGAPRLNVDTRWL